MQHGRLILFLNHGTQRHGDRPNLPFSRMDRVPAGERGLEGAQEHLGAGLYVPWHLDRVVFRPDALEQPWLARATSLLPGAGWDCKSRSVAGRARFGAIIRKWVGNPRVLLPASLEEEVAQTQGL